MTLPASGTITMTNVKNELSTSFPLTLNDSRVHTLFGVSGNPIKLTDGYGKSSAFRPTGVGFSGTSGSHSNDAQAYDSDPATYASLASYAGTAATNSYVATYTGIGTHSGTLSVAITTITEVSMPFEVTYSTVSVTYSVDGGTNWLSLGIGAGGYSDTVYTTPLTASITATGDVQVKITCTHSRAGNPKLGGYESANSSALIYDIKVT